MVCEIAGGIAAAVAKNKVRSIHIHVHTVVSELDFDCGLMI